MGVVVDSKDVKVRVTYFALAREIVGKGEEDITLSSPANIVNLLGRVIEMHPSLSKVERIIHVMVNGRVELNAYQLKNGDRVSIIPPVSGG